MGGWGGLGGGLMTLVWMCFKGDVTGTRYCMMWRSPVASFRRQVAESDFQFQNISEYQLQNLTFQFQNTSFRIPVSEY